ncbi:MAG TPA: trypsin-like peptidase domain-containing protein [Gaiellaceae bacterium]
MRAVLLAVICAALGAGAALGIGRATGLLGSSTRETVVVRGPAAGAAGALAAARAAVLPAIGSAFAPARIYAARAPGVVTVFAYSGVSGAQGSGFVVAPDGLILTNAHVITDAGEVGVGASVKPAARVYVEFSDHDRVSAQIVGWDVFDDVGVLRVAPAAHRLVPLPLGRSAAVVVGEPVASIGSPLGNEDSLAIGVVSAVGRSIAALTAARYQLVDAIQTDAPIAHGSSGGPLLDAAGRVIGITAQIRDDNGGPAGIGFAVPIDSARRSLHDLVATGHVDYAYAGLQTEDLTPALAQHLRLNASHGALVDAVSPGGPAARAGVRGGSREVEFDGEAVRLGGDVILAVNGAPVRSADDVVRIVTNDLRPGQAAVFTVLRAGRQRSLVLHLTTRAAS